MTLVLDSTSKKKLLLLKEIALEMGVKVLQSPKLVDENLSSDTISGSNLSNEDKNYLRRLKKAVPEIKELSLGKKKGQSLKSFLDEV